MFTTKGFSRTLVSSILPFSLVFNCFAADTDLGNTVENLDGSTDNLVTSADTNSQIYNELDCDGARTCSESELQLYTTIEKLIHTAFGGRSDLSTGPDGLRATLYWFNTEESAAQGELASDITTSQISSLSARMNALRTVSSVGNLASAGTSGGAAGDNLANQWGVFVNYGSLAGEKDQSELTNALDFDGNKLTAGIDFRLNDNWVIGVAAGQDTVDSEIGRTDFDVDDTLKPNVAEGSTELDATSASIYALYERDNFYLSGMLMQSSLSYDMERLIAYQSNNSNVPGANDLAVASTDGDQFTSGINIGVSFNQGSLSETLDFGIQTTTTTIDGYAEEGARTLNYAVDEQEIESTLLSLEVKISKVFSTESSVLIPFIRGRLLKQLEDDQFEIKARYAAFESESKFTVLSEVPDTDFALVGVGMSALFKNGIQGFVSYNSIQGYDDLTASNIDFGIRKEF